MQPSIKKTKRSRNGCLTCKARRRKCDETKPSCNNCISANKDCTYGLRLSFDVDDSRHSKFMTLTSNGRVKYGFRGRPRLSSPKHMAEKEIGSNPSIGDCKAEIPRYEDSASSMHSEKHRQPSTPQHYNEKQAGNLSKRSVFNSDFNDLVEQSTFDFINRGLDYLLGGLQSDLASLTEAESRSSNASRLPSRAPSPPTPQESQKLMGAALPEPKNPQKAEAFHSQNPISSQSSDLVTSDLMSFIDNTDLYPSAPELSVSDETVVLRHFFNRLMPLLDSHPNNPWPELALKYCDAEIARSCFLSLSCIHLYGKEGGNELYKTGMLHINSTMDYLIKYAKSNNKNLSSATQHENLGEVSSFGSVINNEKYNDTIKEEINVDSIVGNLKSEAINQKRSSFFVILILIYVHVLFAILESGKSVLSRVFLKLFATIASDDIFKAVLEKIDQSQTCICILSWYDTATAISSPDCRVPYCNPAWFGRKESEISSAKVNGCPGELFECMHRLCYLRRELKYGKLTTQEAGETYKDIKNKVLSYRDYVSLRLNENSDQHDDSIELKPEETYEVRLKGAQCWALSILVKLETVMGYAESAITVETLINEFIMVYASMDPETPLIVQMVWPIFNISCECKTEKQRRALKSFLDILTKNGQTGTLRSMGEIVERCWSKGENIDEILSGKDWLGSGTDFLPI